MLPLPFQMDAIQNLFPARQRLRHVVAQEAKIVLDDLIHIVSSIVVPRRDHVAIDLLPIWTENIVVDLDLPCILVQVAVDAVLVIGLDLKLIDRHDVIGLVHRVQLLEEIWILPIEAHVLLVFGIDGDITFHLIERLLLFVGADRFPAFLHRFHHLSLLFVHLPGGRLIGIAHIFIKLIKGSDIDGVLHLSEIDRRIALFHRGLSGIVKAELIGFAQVALLDLASAADLLVAIAEVIPQLMEGHDQDFHLGEGIYGAIITLQHRGLCHAQEGEHGREYED